MNKLIAAALLLAGSGSVMAQAPGRDEIEPPTFDEVRVMHEFSGCVVGESTGEARRVLALDFRTDSYEVALERLAHRNNRCAPRSSRLRFSGLLLAGGMAEHLFIRDHGSKDPVRLLAERPADPESRSPSEQMSYCIVRRAPAPARAVLAAPPASPEEASAMDTLRPVMSDCLVSAREARLNRPGLRSLIALAFYNLTRAGTPAD
jgi:hypothetical protein